MLRFPTYPYPLLLHNLAFPIINITHQMELLHFFFLFKTYLFSVIHIHVSIGTFFLKTKDELMSTYHNHPKSIRAHSWYCTFTVLGKIMTYFHCCNIIYSIFTALKIPCVLLIHLSFQLSSSHPWKSLIFILSIVLLFPECYVIGNLQYSNLLRLPFFHLVICI